MSDDGRQEIETRELFELLLQHWQDTFLREFELVQQQQQNSSETSRMNLRDTPARRLYQQQQQQQHSNDNSAFVITWVLGGPPEAPPTIRPDVLESLLSPVNLCKSHEQATLGEQSQCVVCLCDFEQEPGCEDDYICPLPCKHIFHKKCISGWLNRKNSCPCCRYEFLTTDDVLNRSIRQRMKGRVGYEDVESEPDDSGDTNNFPTMQRPAPMLPGGTIVFDYPLGFRPRPRVRDDFQQVNIEIPVINSQQPQIPEPRQEAAQVPEPPTRPPPSSSSQRPGRSSRKRRNDTQQEDFSPSSPGPSSRTRSKRRRTE